MNKYADKIYLESFPRLLHSKYDNVFKAIVTAGWCVSSDGDVEANPGYFSLTEIPDQAAEWRDMIEAVWNENLETDASEIDSGWYVTIENETGVIYVYEHKSKSDAERQYATLGQDYAEWLGADDDEYVDDEGEYEPTGNLMFDLIMQGGSAPRVFAWAEDKQADLKSVLDITDEQFELLKAESERLKPGSTVTDSGENPKPLNQLGL